jgi:hypothetical protein
VMRHEAQESCDFEATSCRIFGGVRSAGRRNAGTFMQKACRDFCGDS